MLLTTIVASIFVFGLLIFVHEFGHFLFAKLVKMRVDEFAIGFGPKLFSVKRGETVYSVRAIPLGGFNKIAGMDPEEEGDERSFNKKPIWARMTVIAAGALMNFLLAVVLFAIIALNAGIVQPVPETVIGEVLAGRPAAQAGLQPGDRILAVNGQPVVSWGEFVVHVHKNANRPITLRLERDGTIRDISVTPELDPKQNRGLIGVAQKYVTVQPDFPEAVKFATVQTVLIAKAMLVGVVQMITGRAPAEVAGPLGVAQMAGQFAQLGIIPLLQFAAFVSINLGLLNLFPVPVLDGGRLVLLAVEAVRRRPLDPAKENFIQMLGFALLLLLILVATFKDLVRIKAF